MSQEQSEVDTQPKKATKNVLASVRSPPPWRQGEFASSPHLEGQPTNFTPPGTLAPESLPITLTNQSSGAIEPTPNVGFFAPARADTSTGPAVFTPAIPLEHVHLSSPPSVFATTESAIKDLVGRHDSDILPALKVAIAAIVGLAKSLNGARELQAEFSALQSKLKALAAIPNVPTTNELNSVDNVQNHLRIISEMVQRLWQAISSATVQEPYGRPALRMEDVDNVKSLLIGLASLLELFEMDDSVAAHDRLTIVRQRLSMQPHHAMVHAPSLSIVNQNGNVTYNLGRDVVNNNYVYNYIFAYEAARHTSRLEQHEKAMKTFKKVLGDNFVSNAADDEQPTDAGCMPGTREGVLAQFIRWMKEDYMTIFWLAGMAGTGKTSIALSLCRLLRNSPDVCLASGFFCSRSAGGIARRDVRRILPTLAALLACQSMEFAVALATELDKDRRIGHKPVGDQIGPLIRTPLAALATSTRPIVFVIDALDELSDEKEVAALLRILADFRCEANVKFILTSRPEMHIRGTPISITENSSVLQLHTIEKVEVTSDIRFYLCGRLQDVAPKATWYTEDDIELLLKLSDGLFIFASTVLDFVLGREGDEDRQDRLRMVTSAVTNRAAATSAVDEVYELVITEATKSKTVHRDELERLKRILACVLTARASLSIEALASLIDITPGRLRGSLERLHSLVYLPDDNSLPGVRTLHASFGDYLFERAHEHIQIAPTYGHDTLARGCLRRMAGSDLCFNVSQSQSSFEPNPEMVPDWIELPLIYACFHWAHHIDAASDRSAFDEMVHRSFRPKFLFWLEVLSITRRIGLASGLLRIAHSAVKQEDVASFLRNANAFVASSYSAISKSAPHIYVSALHFTSKESVVYRDFASRCASVISIENLGIQDNSGQLLMTLTGHERKVNSIAYSADGCLLASGSDDGTVRVWDIRTGEEIMSPLQADDGGVLSVAFAPNGQRIASAIRNTVEIWNISTGRAALPPFQGHLNLVRSVAFSPDGALIASSSDDTTVRIWASETGREFSVLKGHTDWVQAVAFAPNGQLLASASKDKTVRLWSLVGETIGAPLTSIQDQLISLTFSSDGHSLAAGSYGTFEACVWNLRTPSAAPATIKSYSSVHSLALSPDGSKLATGGYATVRLWDPCSGCELSGSALVGHSDWVNSVTFSPDGLSLASGSGDCSIRIWEAASGDELDVLPQQMHSGQVFSLVVSPDGSSIVSGSGDRTVRIWDISSGEEKFQPLLGHRSLVYRVAISSNARLIASASADNTIRLWDLKTGEAVGEPLLSHSGSVRAVAFSPDGRWLASGSHDTTVRVWDVSTGTAAAFDVLYCPQIVCAVSFSPDGRVLAAGDSDGYLHCWLSGTNQLARAAFSVSPTSILSIAFSPDAAQIVVGATNFCARVWDVDDGSLVLELEGHSDVIRSVVYSPEGRYIVSASNDKTVRIWDSRTGDCVATLHGHGDLAQSVAFTPDGQSIVSSGTDKTIRIWNVEQALSPSSPTKHDPLSRFHPATIDDEGWLVGSSGELLLWLPPAHRGCIQLPPCSTIIGPYRIYFAAKGPGTGLTWGENWATCWVGGM